MKTRFICFFLALGCSASLRGTTLAVTNTNDSAPGSLPQATLDANSRQVTLQAANRGAPYINLRDGHTLTTINYVGDSRVAQELRANQVRPLTLTSGDFDEDGMPDLVSGYGTFDGAGVITLRCGNVQALWPYGEATQGGTPPAFLPDARVISLPEAPDFLGTGDFNADGHWDIVAARRGGNSLYFLPGDGHGGFGEVQRIELSGSVTAFTTGEINRADGLADIVVGVAGASGARILVFESPNGALRDHPEMLPLSSAATSLVLGQLDDDTMNDLAVAAGRELLIVHGRDRRLTLDQPDRDKVGAAKVTQQSFPFSITTLAVGSFTSEKQDLALLGDDGQVHLLERAETTPVANLTPTIQSATAGGKVASIVAQRATAISTASSARTNQQSTVEWIISGALALPSLSGLQNQQLITAHVSVSPHDDLIVVDAATSQLQIISDAAVLAQSNTIGANTSDGRARMSVAATLDLAQGATAAVLPMRLNPDPLSDLVVLQSGKSEPTTVETAAVATFTVTNTSDSGPGSLRQAMTDADAVNGATSIVFNIPNSDPSTGVFTIKPIGDPSGFTALPGVFKPVTIDGYTQPGSSPNTLVGGDNAVLLIEINGANAGLGPSGISIFTGAAGQTIRGLVINGFHGKPDGALTRGGDGVLLNNSGSFIEGNFMGTNSAGTVSKQNFAGIGSFAEQVGGVTGMVGGTTPQARNLLSGNSSAGFGSATRTLPNRFFVQGNFIGTDVTGKLSVLHSPRS